MSSKVHPAAPALLAVAAILILLLGWVARPPFAGPSLHSREPARRPDLDELHALDFLPRRPATDGSVDYSSELQRALDAAGGRTLILPPFRVGIGVRSGQERGLPAGLTARGSLHLVGAPGSVLCALSGGGSVLRVEDGLGARLEDFAVEGAGGSNPLAAALVECRGGRDVRFERLALRSAAGRALLVTGVLGVSLRDCVVDAPARAGLTLEACRGAVLERNVVRDVLGHVAPSGKLLGAAIEILGSSDVLCADNRLEGGQGAGIAVDAMGKEQSTRGLRLERNTIRGFVNPANPLASCGIQLQNSNGERDTAAVIAGNHLRACGLHGIWIDGHDGIAVRDNWIGECEGSGIVLARVNGAVVERNAVWNPNLAGLEGQAGILLAEPSAQVVLRGNEVQRLPTYAGAAPAPAWLDLAPAGANRVEGLSSAVSSDQTTR